MTADSGKLRDITQRAFSFAVRIVKLAKLLHSESNVARPVIDQLLRAGTSIGANLEEAVAGQSTSDFLHKNSIALKEARETNYWLRLLLETEQFTEPVEKGVRALELESMEIAKIIGSRIVSTKRNNSK